MANRQYRTQVNPKTFKKWKLLREKKDSLRIADQVKLSEQTIKNALTHGIATTETINMINTYYEQQRKIKST